jgi:uncharacterized repeat protein (TIGR01451 family)
VKWKYLSLTVAVCLGGALLALLGLLLASSARAGHVSQVRGPADVPDLIISVQPGSETVLADEVISFTLLYTNTLLQPLSDVVISSTLSSQQYYSGTYLSDPPVSTASFTHSGGLDDGYVLIWQLGPLSPETEGWIVVTTTLPPDAEPPWNDRERWPLLGASAVITTSTPEVSVGNPQGQEGDSATVMVVGPVLQIDKADDPDPVRPGRLLTYTLTLQNKDREDTIAATGIVITDLLPASTIFERAGGTGVYSPTSPGTGLVIWHPPASLGRGSTMAVSFTVRLTESMPSCPPQKIKNDKNHYGVRVNERIRPLVGRRTQETGVDDVLEKTIETPDPPSGDNSVFPGGIVTYTVSIYNPRHAQPITDLRLTDTLPGGPNLITFLDMLGGGPTPVITYPQVIWENLSVPAGGVTSFSFRAQVPYHIHIGSNRTSRDYDNSLSASVPGLVICDMKDKGPSRARVTRQIELRKSVEPDHVLSGERVTYTITLENMGHTLIDSIRLTDTLPNTGGADFYYVRMVDGPEPVAGYQHNPVVWEGLSVPGDGQVSLSFQAVAIGLPLQRYGDDLSASSPWTTIPDRTDKAKVEIDPPLGFIKTVDPAETFVEQTVHYDVQICNVATGTYTLDRFEDFLPTGFYASGMNPYTFDISPPQSLAPGECWTHGFDARATLDVGCGNLPRTYKNSKGHMMVHVVDPVDAWFANASDAAPLKVNPHVTIEKDRDHIAVLPGETFVYTITLENTSSIPVNDVTVVDTLPDGFEYVARVRGPDPADTEAPTIVWEGQTVPAEGQLVLAFRVQAPEGTALGKYKNKVEATTSDLACIKGTGETAQVEVVDQIIELSKVASPSEVPPLGVVRYEIRLKNVDSVPITGVTVTETLPSALGEDFAFVGMAGDDPEPIEINGRHVIWRDLTVPGAKTLKLRFDARATVLFGDYDNDVSASCPWSPITPEEDDVRATVKVLPGVILYKTVFPTQTVSGRTVVYTVTLRNGGTRALEDVRITDTLPAGFSYRRTLDGPLPVQRSPVLAWELNQLGQGKSEDFVFQVQVGLDVVTGTYFNKIEGYSPSALVPGVGETAPLEVEGVDVSRVYLPLVLRACAQ